MADRITCGLAVAGLCLMASGGAAHAAESVRAVGLRGVMQTLPGGVPSNDQNGYGIVYTSSGLGRFDYGLSLDRLAFDYEEPYKVLGIARPNGTQPIDGLNEATVLSGWLGRSYASRQSTLYRWFWRAGLGFADVSAERVSGPTASGSRFDISTTAKNQLHLHAASGMARDFARIWRWEISAYAEYQNIDYALRDNVSGARATIGAKTLYGLHFTLLRRF